jgi:N-acetylneuraminic acid mutarotase
MGALTRRAALQLFCLAGISLALVDCGGSSTTTPVATTNYTIGGTISGLTVSSVVLANGSATATVLAGATTWSFPNSFTAGSSYTITVQTQPSGEHCEITSGGSGNDTGFVGNVVVTCGFGQWSWQQGANTVNASAVYGTQGTPAASNLPGASYSGSSWTDSSGSFWLFGGVGYDSTGATGYLNSLWRYIPSSKQWTWISGGSIANASGIYGTQGTVAASNAPGGRYQSSSWIDASGNLWLFGGFGYDGAAHVGELNDLWRCDSHTGLWTWVSGGSAINASGVYGTLGTAAAGNVPGARYAASSWIDSSGNLWLFGGFGYDASGGVGKLNDLWRFSPSTGQWTWIAGGSGLNASGVYGTLATAAAGNVPGARYAASTWADSSGNLWLFGGNGYDSSGAAGKLNDLWQYSPSSGQWTWVNGEDVTDAPPIYAAALGIASAGSVPGARYQSSSWIDSAGNLWLFGGVGYDLGGNVGNLNDLWEYVPSLGEWTWRSGADTENASGAYGAQGAASVSNTPGGRNSTGAWLDSSGNLWLFGGYGYDASGNLGYLNDLWQFDPSTS